MESFQKSNFDLDQYTKQCLDKTIKFGTLAQVNSIFWTFYVISQL